MYIDIIFSGIYIHNSVVYILRRSIVSTAFKMTYFDFKRDVFFNVGERIYCARV